MKEVRVRPAGIEEAAALTDLVRRSKAAWGYDAAFMAAVDPVLRIDPAAIAEGWVWVAEDARGRVQGVYAIARTDNPEVIVLDSMFVEPAAMRTGVGAVLFRHAAEAARRYGARVLSIEADPNAAPFYERMGARRSGAAPGATPGRVLPVYELDL
ncbi:MAG: GNAT family N-acetyltransferase [Caulobacterales bacterium]